MSKKICVWLLGDFLAGTAFFAEAQQPEKVPRIGYLATAAPRSSPLKHFCKGCGISGTSRARTLLSSIGPQRVRLNGCPDQVAELVSLKVDIIVADGTGASLAAKKATSTIPIVMTSSSDPVGTGLIASLARPGGNVTGLTSVTGELGGKLLELLKEIVPRLTRVAIALPGPDSPAYDSF